MAREIKRSSEKNDGQDLEMEKFLEELANNTPNTEQFEDKEDE